MYQRQARNLKHFHITSLKKIPNIEWHDNVPDTEVLTQVGLRIIFYTILMKCQLHWAGHVVRMSDHRLPNRLFYGELQKGQRSHGGQNKLFKVIESVQHKP